MRMTWQGGSKVVGIVGSSLQECWQLLRVIDPTYTCSAAAARGLPNEPEVLTKTRQTIYQVDPVVGRCLHLYCNTNASVLYLVLVHTPDASCIVSMAAAVGSSGHTCDHEEGEEGEESVAPHSPSRVWESIEEYQDGVMRAGCVLFSLSDVVLLLSCHSVLDTAILYKLRVMQVCHSAVVSSRLVVGWSSGAGGPVHPPSGGSVSVMSGDDGRGGGTALSCPTAAVVMMVDDVVFFDEVGAGASGESVPSGGVRSAAFLESQVARLMVECQPIREHSPGALFKWDKKRLCFVIPRCCPSGAAVPTQWMELQAFIDNSLQQHGGVGPPSPDGGPTSLPALCLHLCSLLSGLMSSYSTAAASDTPEAPAPAIAQQHTSGVGAAMQWAVSCGRPISRYSAAKCNRAMAVATDTYSQSVPELYSASIHHQALESSMRAYCSIARGPRAQQTAHMLAQQCTQQWKQGHQQCSATSLWGHPCSLHPHPLPTTPPPHGSTTATTKQMKGTDHVSGVEYYMANPQGTKQGVVDDPFDFTSANEGPTGPILQSGDAISLTVTAKHVAGGDVSPVSPAFPVGGWCHVTRLGPASSYTEQEGLPYPGFEKGHKFLYSLNLQLTTTESSSSTLDSVEFPPLAPTPSPASTPCLGSFLAPHQPTAASQTQKLLSKWPSPGQSLLLTAAPHASNTSVGNTATTNTNQQHKVLEVPRRAGKDTKSGKKGVRGVKGGVKEEGTAPAAVHPMGVMGVQSVKVMVGMEYECKETGSRLLLSPPHLGSGHHPAKSSVSTAAARFMLSTDLPLFMEMAVEAQDTDRGKGGRKGSSKGAETSVRQLFQLRRMWVVTPEPPLQLASQPTIRFQWSSSGPGDSSDASSQSVEFEPQGCVALPPSSLVVITLPWLYGAQQKTMKGVAAMQDSNDGDDSCDSLVPLIQTSASHPYQSFLVAGTALFPI